jgi:hypothetical protein
MQFIISANAWKFLQKRAQMRIDFFAKNALIALITDIVRFVNRHSRSQNLKGEREWHGKLLFSGLVYV